MANSVFITPLCKRSVENFTSNVRLLHQDGFASNDGFNNAAKGFDDDRRFFVQTVSQVYFSRHVVNHHQTVFGSEYFFFRR